MARILVVGAGFAGVTYARVLAEAGHFVDIIDRREHVGGNAYDYVDENGIRVHRYGPHLFHTNNETVVKWLSQFGEWITYEHRVRALLDDGSFVSLPINRRTVEHVFGVRLPTEDDVRSYLARVAVPIDPVRNAADHLYSTIGKVLTDLFFRPYTKKMWELDLEELDASVVKRIPLRYDDEDRYFPTDRFQIMPQMGYTALFDRILEHDNIATHLSTEYDADMNCQFSMVFSSSPIDEYYGYCFGPLPYRSIRFSRETRCKDDTLTWAVTNFTDASPITRETYWHVIPGHDHGASAMTVSTETPCDYKDNNYERYYPVKTSDNRYSQVYDRYCDLAAREEKIKFIGRCGTYQYLDMHQVINQSLQGASKWTAAQDLSTWPHETVPRSVVTNA